MASTCRPFADAVAVLRRERRRHASDEAPRLAVCLTGQLRLFMIGFPALVRHLLLGAAAKSRVDFFYVGPSDLSYARGKAYLLQLPGLRASTLYEPRLVWSNAHGAALAAELVPILSSGNGSRAHRAFARFNLRGLEQCGGPLKSRLVQALQSRECLRLIDRAEASEQSAGSRTGGSRTGGSRRYEAVLRLRADALTLRPTELPRARANDPTYSSLHDCPPSASGELAKHDYLLYGERELMGHVLSVLDGMSAAALVRAKCDFGALARAKLSHVLPGARCISPGNRTPVGSVRGSVSGGCYFVDQEHPPNDGEAQPRLKDVFPGASAVASECIGLRERRDGRRPGAGPACAPRGGWDGDFREDASPWDSIMNSISKPNQGAGR